MTILAATAITARSVALAGFGPDSLIEIGASTVVVWELSGTGAARQRRALSLIGSAVAALALYLAVQSTRALAVGHRAGTARPGSPGPRLPRWSCSPSRPARPAPGPRWTIRSCAPKAGSPLIDAILATAVLLGLALNAGLGWRWADPLAGYMLVFYATGETRTILTGRH